MAISYLVACESVDLTPSALDSSFSRVCIISLVRTVYLKNWGGDDPTCKSHAKSVRILALAKYPGRR